jgi:hypothetical protein
MTRIRVPPGLAVAAGVYRVHGSAIDGSWHATSEVGDRVDLGSVWDDLRDAVGVEINCPKHPDAWWPTVGTDLPLSELSTWRCPACAWAFREGLKGRGGSPQF